MYGIDSVPERWRNVIPRRELLMDTADQLIEAAARREE